MPDATLFMLGMNVPVGVRDPDRQGIIEVLE